MIKAERIIKNGKKGTQVELCGHENELLKEFISIVKALIENEVKKEDLIKCFSICILTEDIEPDIEYNEVERKILEKIDKIKKNRRI